MATLQDCLRELGRLIHQDHGPTCVAAAQELQAAEKDAADASTKRPADEAAALLNANDVLMLRETRAPVTHQERRRRSEVSEEEFERRQVLVKHQSFLGVAATHRQRHTFQVERESQLLV